MQQEKLSRFTTFASHINDMHELIKCPICLEILKSPVELRCNHIFCVACIEQCTKGKNFNCPICCTHVSKRNSKHAKETDGVIKFVQAIAQQVQNGVLPHKKSYLPVEMKKIESTKSSPPNIKISNERKGTESKKKKLNEPRIPEKRKNAIKPLIQSEPEGQVLGSYTMNWLANSKNQFEKCSPIQHSAVDSPNGLDISTDSLKSISQAARDKRNTMPLTRNAHKTLLQQGQKRAKPNRKCRSLELMNANRPMLPKRAFNLGKFNTPFEEESHIEENDIKPLAENRKDANGVKLHCLHTTRTTTKRKTPESETDDEDNLNKSGRSGWSSIGKITKIVDKAEPKRLKVTLTPTKGTENKTIDLTSAGEPEFSVFLSPMFKQRAKGRSNQSTSPVKTNIERKAAPKEKHAETVHKFTVEKVIEEVDMLNSSKEKSQEVVSIHVNDNDNYWADPVPVELDVAGQYEQLVSRFSDFTLELDTFLVKNHDHTLPQLKNMQFVQSKISKINEFLNLTSATPKTTSSQTTQTDTPHKESKNTLVQTSPIKLTLSPPRVTKTKMLHKESQTDTIPASIAEKIPKKTIVLPDFDNSLDLNAFDTQIAMAELAKSAKTKNIHTEKMVEDSEIGFSEILRDLNEANNKITQNVVDAPQPHKPVCTKKVSDLTEKLSPVLPLKKRAEMFTLNDSFDEELMGIDTGVFGTPKKTTTQTPDPDSPIRPTAKRAKPLAFSDSDDDLPKEIVNKYKRDDLSVCFDVDSPILTAGEAVDAEAANDQFVDDVFDRIQKQLECTNREQEMIADNLDKEMEKSCVIIDVQTAIKADTQDIIDKLDQQIRSNSPQPNNKSLGPKNSPKTSKSPNLQAKTDPLPKVSSVNLLSDSIFQDDINEDLFDKCIKLKPSNSSIDKPKSTLHNVHSDSIYKDSNCSSSVSTRILDDRSGYPSLHGVTVLQNITIPTANAVIVHELDVETRAEKVRPITPAPYIEDTDDEVSIIVSSPEVSPKKPRKPFVFTQNILLPPPTLFRDPPALPVAPVDDYAHETFNMNLASKEKENLMPAPSSQGTCSLSPIRPLPAAKPRQYLTPKLRANTIRRVTSTPLTKTKHLNQTSMTQFVRKASLRSALNAIDNEELFRPTPPKKPTVCYTRLDKNQVASVQALAQRKLVGYSPTFDSSVTHMVVAADEDNCVRDLTMKYIKAVAAGIWVVNFAWIQDSLSNNALVAEDVYEILDDAGTSGPTNARLYHNTRPLFKGFKIHVAGPFLATTQLEVEELVVALGGIITRTPEGLLPKENYICLILSELRENQESEQSILHDNWLETLGVVTVEFEWFTFSIGQYKLMSLWRYALCAKDTLRDLGYPEELTKQVPLTFTQGTR